MPEMGLIRTEITLRNPRDRSLAPLTATALVDTGALHLCIPEHLAIQLKLERLEEREVTTADGIKRLCAYVGPIELRFGNRGAMHDATRCHRGEERECDPVNRAHTPR